MDEIHLGRSELLSLLELKGVEKVIALEPEHLQPLESFERPIILDDTPAGYRPIVQAIDNFERNHKLGLIFETRIGRGKLLVCAIDLLGHQDKPEARQLLHSLLRYVDSAAFAPKAKLDADLLKKLFPDAT